MFCERYSHWIPLTFVLGFYVSFVIGRWWSWYNSIPWPDQVALYCATYIGSLPCC